MGNCLVRQDKVIKVMKKDGEVSQYKEPMKVHQVLSEFAGKPFQESPMEFEEKDLEYLKPEVEVGKVSSGIVRIKLVITKQELEEILRKGGISLAELVSRLQKNGGSEKFYDENHGKCKGWKPVLESISEVN